MASLDPFASPPRVPNRQSQRSSYRKSTPNLNAPLPPLPADELEFDPAQLNHHITSTSTYTSPFDDPIHHVRRASLDLDDDFLDHDMHNGHLDQDPFTDDDAIPLRPQYPYENYGNHDREYNSHLDAPLPPPPPLPPVPHTRRSRDRSYSPRRPKHKFFSFQTPWVTYILTFIQITVFLIELIKAGMLTGSPIEIHPTINPMLGPSPYVLINMGARYVPCMRNQQGVQNANETITWPCPNATTSTAQCTLSELCGFNGVPMPTLGGSLDATPAPNQWFRFITPIFLHAGFVHIGFNMLLQVLLGGDMERIIGHVRFFFVYFASGIFGFVMGGNFAPAGIASTGASGALFGCIALLLLDLLYNWSTRRTPYKDLLFIILDISISFVLGLLPGVDNFSHIGGFIMGLLLGIFLLRSPNAVRKKSGGVRLPVDGEEALGLGVGEREVTRPVSTMSTRTIGGTSRPPTNKFSPLPPLPLPERLRSTSPLPPALDVSKTMAATTSAIPNPSGLPTLPDDPALPPPPGPKTSRLATPKRALHWIWWSIRIAALVMAVVFLVLLVKGFYRSHETTCGWCRYLSCLPVEGWCEIGELVFVNN